MPDNPGEPTLGEGLLTFDEVATLFGGEIPAEAISLIFNDAPSDWTVRQVREELQRMATRTPPDEVTQKLIERLLERVRRWAATGEHVRVTVPLPELQAAASALATQAAELHGIKASMEYRHSLIGRTEARATKAERDLAEARAAPKIEFHQQDWIPGFAAFLPEDTTPPPTSRAFCVLNLGAFVGAVDAGDLDAADLPYIVAESMMHEVIHALEQWAGVEFSEERVEALLERYRQALASTASRETDDER